MREGDRATSKEESRNFSAQRTSQVERAGPTVSHVLGEMVWLLSQSPTHRRFTLADLEWLIMPPILLRQYRVFYSEKEPVGYAVWAYCSAETEERFEKGAARLRPEEWKASLDSDLDGSAKAAGQSKLWLVDLVAPFATSEDKMIESMMTDLANGPFKGRDFWFHRTDPKTGKRTAVRYRRGH